MKKNLKKVKVITGSPLYCYDGKISLEPNPKYKYGSMYYDEQENVTFVYQKRKTYFRCLLYVAVIAVMVFAIYTFLKLKFDVSYNEICTYHNGYAYFNITNNGNTDVYCDVYVDNTAYFVTLHPGETLDRFPVEYRDTYTILLRYFFYNFKISKVLNVQCTEE